MNRHSFYPIVIFVIGLAMFGLFYELITNTTAFLSTLFYTALTIALIIYLFKRFLSNKYGAQYYRQKPKRVKYSKPQAKSTHSKTKNSRPLVRKRSEVNLTVIEGKKSKKKNRAHF